MEPAAGTIKKRPKAVSRSAQKRTTNAMCVCCGQKGGRLNIGGCTEVKMQQETTKQPAAPTTTLSHKPTRVCVPASFPACATEGRDIRNKTRGVLSRKPRGRQRRFHPALPPPITMPDRERGCAVRVPGLAARCEACQSRRRAGCSHAQQRPRHPTQALPVPTVPATSTPPRPAQHSSRQRSKDLWWRGRGAPPAGA